MIAILSIMFGILIADQLINRFLIKKHIVEAPGLYAEYVNRFHEYAEKILFGVNLAIFILATTDFPHLRLLIFIGLIIIFGFRTLMECIFRKENKLYVLSFVTFVLSIIGSVVYGTYFY